MKVKRKDTKEARRYWKSLDENSKVVATWPAWKRGASESLRCPECSGEIKPNEACPHCGCR